MLANRRTKAAQVQYNPVPAYTRMPRETFLVVIVHELIRPAALTRAVQIAEPTRIDMPATAARMLGKDVQVHLKVYSKIPLGGMKASEPKPK